MKFSHLTRVYNTSLINKNQTITFEGDSFHYIKTVLRMKLGEKLRVFNERDGEYLAQIIELGKSRFVIQVEELFRNPLHEKQLTLAICVIKPDRIIEALKAAVQIGITEFTPIISERTQTKIISLEKFNRASIQATEQSERFLVPNINEPILLSALLENAHDQQIIFANEEEKNTSIKDISLWQQSITLLVGPEGGFTQEEKDKINKIDNTISVSLGNNVLRAEVAATSALACIQLLRG